MKYEKGWFFSEALNMCICKYIVSLYLVNAIIIKLLKFCAGFLNGIRDSKIMRHTIGDTYKYWVSSRAYNTRYMCTDE